MKFQKKQNLLFVSVLILFLFAPFTVNAEGWYQFASKWGTSGCSDSQFSSPSGVAVDSSGNIYVADTNNHRIQKFTSTGTFITKWGSNATCTAITVKPLIIGNKYRITNYISNDDFTNVGGTNVTGNEFTATGDTPIHWIHLSPLIEIPSPGTGDGQFSSPGGVVVDSSGNVYVADTNNQRIQKFTSTGTFITKWGSSGTGNGQFSSPSGVAIDSSGNVYVADMKNNRIQKFTSMGAFITKWGSSGSGDSELNYPSGIAIDPSGYIYVVDTNNNRIQKFISMGTFVTKWGSMGTDDGSVWYPGGVAVDSSGNAYVVDKGNQRIQKFSPLITIFATNSVGPRNTIKITDTSGTLSASGGTITVMAWDANGIAIPESGNAVPLKLYSHATTTITGPELAVRFPTGTPMTYEFNVESSKTVITNVKNSTDGSINVPIVYTKGLTNYATNSVGLQNTIKITDMSGLLPYVGAVITVSAYDASGTAVSESASATTLMLSNRGTTSILGSDLATRFPIGAPITYEFTVASSKTLITNIKNSADGSINIPNVYRNGLTNYATNSVGPQNTIKITDMSGTLTNPVAITVKAYDANGTEIPEFVSATTLMLSNRGTTSIPGSDLAARFLPGVPMTYEFTVGSSKVVITNVKNSTDGSINIPTVYTSGTTNFSTNSVGPRNTIKITDMSGALPDAGVTITVQAWQSNGFLLNDSATPLKLYNHGTTSISGSDLAARFPSGTPMSYEFTVGSSRIIITNVKSNASGTLNIPTVYTNGVGGAI